MTHSPTPEQQQAIDGFATGRNITIEAAAGTGKTSTLRFLADVDQSRRGLYIAFNKSVQEEAKRKFAGTNIEARTAHSLAYRHLPDDLRWKLSNGGRMPSSEQGDIIGLRFGLEAGDRFHSTPVKRHVAIRMTRETVMRYVRTASDTITPDMVPVPAGLGLGDAAERDLQEQVSVYARKYWNNILDPEGRLPFQHDYYVKMWALDNPQLQYDYILLDEAQDSDPLLSQVLLAQRETQLVAVGDRSQAIYGWRGAIDSMDAFGGDIFQLTQSFRFGHAIAEEANVWLELLDASLRVRGTENPSSVHPTYNRHANAVLCRSNAGAIAEVIDGHRRGLAVGIAGKNRAGQIKELAKAAKSLIEQGWTSHPDLDAFPTWDAVREFAEEDADGADLLPLVKLIDTYEPDTIINAIDACVPTEQADIQIATVHVAKGLEWKHVRISDDFPIPGVDDEEELEKMTDEAMMLAYVAVTRAQRHLDNTGLAWAREYRRTLRNPQYGRAFYGRAQAERSEIREQREDTIVDASLDRFKSNRKPRNSSGGNRRNWDRRSGSADNWSPAARSSRADASLDAWRAQHASAGR